MRGTTLSILVAIVVSVWRTSAAEHGPGDAVATAPGMRPIAWPKRLVSLQWGKEVRYRDTEYHVLAFLENEDAWLQVKRGNEVVSKLWLWDGGQFGILDMPSPMPVLEGWGERFDELAARWLILPVRSGNATRYEFAYIEFYTPNKVDALALDGNEVQLRPNAKKRVVYFLGHHMQYSQQQAVQRLKEVLKLR